MLLQWEPTNWGLYLQTETEGRQGRRKECATCSILYHPRAESLRRRGETRSTNAPCVVAHGLLQERWGKE